MDDRRENYRAWGALRTAQSRSRRETLCPKTTWCSSYAFIRLRDDLRFRAKRSAPRATHHD